MKKKYLVLVISAAVIIGLVTSCTHEQKESSKPNILLAIMDDASYAHISAYGCTWVNTPHFDRIANEGILFTNAYTPNAKCAPSRASILTGRNSWQLEEAANHWCYFPEKFITYTEVLGREGYHVGYTGKGWAPGIAESNGKPRQLTGKSYNNNQLQPPTSSIAANNYVADFNDFLQAKKDDTPFCFWFGAKEPHRAYEFGSGVSVGKKKLSDIDSVYTFWPDNDTIRHDLLDYAFEIEYFDAILGEMLEVLEERGELENTLILVTSDNGMPFPRIKGQEYELSNHMPLAVMWPQGIMNPGRTVNDFVSFIDFAPTFLELAGIVDTVMQPIEGKSLTNIFYAQDTGRVDPTRDHVLIGKERHDIGRPDDVGYPIRGIILEDYLFLQNFEPGRWPAGNPITGYLNCDGSPTKTACLDARGQETPYDYWQLSFGKRPEKELYNVKNDPLCLHNLANDPNQKDRLNQLKDKLYAALKTQGDPRIYGNGSVFDQYPYAYDGARDFYRRYLQGEELPSGWVNPTDFEKTDE